MLLRYRGPRTVLATSVILCGLAVAAGAARQGPAMPPDMPEPARARLTRVAETATVSAQAAGEPFLARRDVFEYLLDHPEFASHLTRALGVGRYRIWREPDGLWLDDGWGAVGRFTLVHAASGMRVFHAQGAYQQRWLPDIHGQAVVLLEYGFASGADHRALVTATVTGFVQLDSRLLALAGKLLGDVATRKAHKEARKIVRTFARVTRAVDEDPTRVHDLLRQRSDVPAREFEEFRRLLTAR